LLFFSCFVLATTPLSAHEIITTKLTWTEHISRIFQRRCVGCHQPDGLAPFPFTTHEQVRPWAKAIKYEVLNRRMPPWDAVKGFGAFRNDLGLSQEEIAVISSWVEGGAPEGESVYLPEGQITGEPFQEGPTPPDTKALELRSVTVIREAITAIGLLPEALDEGAFLEITARMPDGSVTPLLWLRDYHPPWKRTYYFRDPIDLPPGTRIEVYPQKAAATLVIAGP
jgi:hypothetical protein